MEHAAEDYYDMPVEMLPSANFAGRPTSEISTSMLDGYWTVMVSPCSNREDEEADDDDDTTLQLRTPLRSTVWQTQSKSPDTPTIGTMWLTLNDGLGLRRRSLNKDVKMMDEPRWRKKWQTAPPGALEALIASPLEPRRAISVRLAYTKTIRRGQPKPCDGFTNWVDMRKAPSKARLGPRKALPKPPCQDDETMSSGIVHHSGSFSDKARVQETLKQKQLRTLNTALADFESSKLPTSPSSILSTPRECYAIPNELATSETLGSPHSSRSWGRKAVKSGKSIVVHDRTYSMSTARVNVEGRPTLKRKHDVDAAERRRVYLPGAIMLAEHPAKLRRDSVATLDPFTFERTLESTGRRISDTVGLDGIIMFFEDFGVVGKVTEVTFDQYWLRESLIVGGGTDGEVEDMAGRRRASVCSVEETGPMGAWAVAKSPPREGLKSTFSSASSTVAMHPPEKRKRSRLRGLLSPGLPSAGFLKSPATWGQ